MESPIDTSHDITTNEVWIGKQIDRISGWEILKKNIDRDYRPIKPKDLCDKMGVCDQYVSQVIQSVKNKVNAKQ
tara:strand:- start:116 stop:337 length:222 start_codon:yes stop_codon:yes gene_type:complete